MTSPISTRFQAPAVPCRRTAVVHFEAQMKVLGLPVASCVPTVTFIKVRVGRGSGSLAENWNRQRSETGDAAKILGRAEERGIVAPLSGPREGHGSSRAATDALVIVLSRRGNRRGSCWRSLLLTARLKSCPSPQSTIQSDSFDRGEKWLRLRRCQCPGSRAAVS
jgi:hypothetical protein